MNPEENKDLDGHFITDLVEDFGAMVKNGVEWKNALLHVLDIALEVSEENANEYVQNSLENVYRQGFRHGVKTGIEGSTDVLLEHLEEVETIFELEDSCSCSDHRDACSECGEEINEEAEDLTIEEFDAVQRIIKESKLDEKQ